MSPFLCPSKSAKPPAVGWRGPWALATLTGQSHPPAVQVSFTRDLVQRPLSMQTTLQHRQLENHQSTAPVPATFLLNNCHTASACLIWI
ncbi:hypothetical protein VTN77DRAFT_1641 [Rasamsonia byssochlamydoides]|uniref:uncharacterized protein n=1 Tax=Rasamsonia byssochlamydoides TaxID=89139 RepID=UPI003742DACF